MQSCRGKFEALQKRVAERRKMLEGARRPQIASIRHKIERIAQQDLDYAQRLFEELIPARKVDAGAAAMRAMDEEDDKGVDGPAVDAPIA